MQYNRACSGLMTERNGRQENRTSTVARVTLGGDRGTPMPPQLLRGQVVLCPQPLGRALPPLSAPQQGGGGTPEELQGRRHRALCTESVAKHCMLCVLRCQLATCRVCNVLYCTLEF